MKLEVIHENEEYLVVNKTGGLISEKSPFEDWTVEDQVNKYLTKKKRKPFIGIIHRLDRVTSGILIFAKKKSVLVSFNELFSSRKVKKTYWAVVKNKPTKEKEKLVHFLFKNKGAQEAILTYEVIGKNNFGYLLKIKPKTGRFHQIRAQLAHIGLPIIGDEKYGSDQKYLHLSICLHAQKISYQILGTKEVRSYQTDAPNNEFWKF